MANPLPNEAEIFERLKEENITVHPLVWELINHHVGNDIHIIQFITGNYVLGDNPEAIPPEHGKKILDQCDELSDFIKRLKETTRETSHKRN